MQFSDYISIATLLATLLGSGLVYLAFFLQDKTLNAQLDIQKIEIRKHLYAIRPKIKPIWQNGHILQIEIQDNTAYNFELSNITMTLHKNVDIAFGVVHEENYNNYGELIVRSEESPQYLYIVKFDDQEGNRYLTNIVLDKGKLVVTLPKLVRDFIK